LPAVLARLAEAASLIPLPEVAACLAETGRRLAELVVEVAVVGEFNRGKSTLINALIGAEVLPTGALPLTTVPTVLERGDPGCLIRFSDGRVEPHPPGKLAQFVTEQANPGNRLGVARATVFLRSPLLDAGVRLVDTPGVGSVVASNTDITGAYLPSLDAAVLVTAADPPISASERTFLTRVAEHAVRLFVVLNKADHLAPEDLARATAFTERITREVMPGWAGPVYALSARPGVGDPAALAWFRDDLAGFLRHGRAAAVTDSARRTATRALGKLRMALELERAAMSLPIQELTHRRDRATAIIRASADQRATDRPLLNASVDRAAQALDAVAARHLRTIRAALDQATVRAAAEHSDVPAGRLLAILQADRPAMLRELASPALAEATAAAETAWRRAAQPVVDQALAQLEQLRAELATIFELPPPPPISAQVDLRTIRVRFTTPNVLSLGQELAPAAWRLRGAAAARAKALARARQAAADEAGMLMGRLRGEVTEQLYDAARRLASRLVAEQQEAAADLRAALDRGAGLLEQANHAQRERRAILDRASRALDVAAEGIGRDAPHA
jgi:GTP-binding protein EngB required for normal cell division